MAKLITTRFPTKCRKCSQDISVGSRGYWTKGYGTVHVHCPNQNDRDGNGEMREDNRPDPEGTPGKKTSVGLVKADDVPGDIPTYRTDFAALKADYEALNTRADGKQIVSSLNSAKVGSYAERWSDPDAHLFYGVKRDEMLRYLREGFRVNTLDNVDSLIPMKTRRRVLVVEDGDEMLIDKALSGDDTYFVEMEKRQSKPGLHVVINCTFSASCDAGVISRYGQWVAQALYTLETLGFDCVVSYRITQNHAVTSGPYAQTITAIDVRVKKENEAADFSRFSSLFSPGGFRHLGFLAIMKMADHFKGTVNECLGYPVAEDNFTVKWNSEKRELYFGNPNTSERFPDWKMTEEFRVALNAIVEGK